MSTVKIFSALTAFAAVCHLYGLTVAEAEKFTTSKEISSSQVITFEEKDFIRKKFKPGISVVKEGINWTRCLKVSKKNADRVTPIGLIQIKSPKPGMRYRLSAYMRAELPPGVKVKENTKIEILGIDHSWKGKWLGGSYSAVPLPEREWKRYDIMEFSPKQHPCNMLLITYLYTPFPATVWIDDIRLEAMEPDPVAVLLKPCNLAFTKDQPIEFELTGSGTVRPGTKALIALGKVKKIAEFDKNGKLLCRFTEKFAVGSYPFTITILNVKSKQKVKSFKWQIRITDESTPPANAAVPDKYGRLIVNGKPFMPVGFFGGSFNETLAKQFAGNGINTLLYYGLIGGRRTPDAKRIAEIDDLMKLADRNGIKIIPCLIQQTPTHAARVDSFKGAEGVDDATVELVNHIKQYPALLAWYIADETPVNDLHKVIRIRENVSAADIWHSTYSITCRPEDFPLFGIAGDIVGVDPYPVSADAAGCAVDISRCASWVIAAGRNGQTVWMIPQLTNLGNIRFAGKPEEFRTKSRGPSADEFVAMPLLGAIYGAKGFISYAYFDMERSEKMQPGYMKENMPNFFASTRLLRKLEPYIMGIGSRPVKVISCTSQKDFHAGILRAENGRECVIVCNSGVGDMTAVFRVDGYKGKFKSEFGRIREVAPGKFEFTAKGVQADVLFPAE